MTKNKEKSPNYISTAVVRALKILTLFNKERPTLSLTEISEALGVNRTVPYRLIYTLQEVGYLKQDEKTKRYELTPKVLELGFSFLHSYQLTEMSKSYLEDIRDKTSESAHLGILDGDEVVYIAKAQAHGFSALSINIGVRTPAYATSIGKALLPFLPEDRLKEIISNRKLQRYTDRTKHTMKDLLEEFSITKEKKYVMNLAEYEVDIYSIAVPIFNNEGEAVAAINVSGSKNQLSETYMLEEVLPILQKAAKELSNFA